MSQTIDVEPVYVLYYLGSFEIVVGFKHNGEHWVAELVDTTVEPEWEAEAIKNFKSTDLRGWIPYRFQEFLWAHSGMTDEDAIDNSIGHIVEISNVPPELD